MAFDMRGHGETTTKDDLDLSSKTLSAVPTPCLPNRPVSLPNKFYAYGWRCLYLLRCSGSTVLHCQTDTGP